jgi:alpha,alpha-trehalase
MIRDIYFKSRRLEYLRTREIALHNEYLFWMTERAGPYGLNRYWHNANDEYLLSFYDDVLVPRLGFSRDLGTDDKRTISGHYLAEAEATCDFTSRFLGRAGDFLATDLNANLAGYERNFAWFANELDRASEELYWERRYRSRQRLMEQLFWSSERGYYFDYDTDNNAHSPAITAAAFSVLWNEIAPPEHAAVMRKTLRFLETDHGVLSTDKQHMDRPFQWDYPFGWPPHQYIVVHGLLNYGYEEDARRIARKYLLLMAGVFKRTGHLWEKYDVVTGDLRDTEYPTETQLGWTAGVFADFTALLER